MHVGGLRERALLVARDRDDLRALTLQMRRQQHELVGFAGIREHHDDIFGSDHAEIAVTGFRRMNEERRRAGRCKRGRELSRDVAGLAHAGDDDAYMAVENHLDGANERLRQPVGKRRDCARFGSEHLTSKRERTRRIDRAMFDGVLRD